MSIHKITIKHLERDDIDFLITSYWTAVGFLAGMIVMWVVR